MRKIFIALSVFTVIAGVMFTGCSGSEEVFQTSGTISVAENTTAKSSEKETVVTTVVQSTTAETTAVSTTETSEKETQPATAKSGSSSSSSNGSSSSSKTLSSSSKAVSSSSKTADSSSKTSSSSSKVSSGSSKVSSGSSKTISSGSFTSSDTVFKYNGKKIELGENMSSVISKIGEANSVSSAPSCHGEGEDKTYSYSGFEIYTYPSNSKEIVNEIMITSSSIPTSKGIKVGDSDSKVVSTYGNNYTEIGSYRSYSAGGNKSLEFYISDGVVTQIDYYYDV